MPLVLSPKLHSRLLKRQNQRVHFFVWTDISHLSSIELWSNLNQHKTWHATSFTRFACNGEQNINWYQLVLPLLQPCGTYEYTLRYWKNGQQVWLGSCFDNGTISVIPSADQIPPAPPCLLDQHFLTLLNSDQRTFWIYKIQKRTGHHAVAFLTMNRMHSYVALARKSSCWLVPVSGTTLFEHDARPWQLLIWTNTLDGFTSAWMVRTCKTQDGWLHVNTSTLVLELHTLVEENDDEDKENTMTLIYGKTTGTSDNAIKDLVSTMLARLAKHQQQRQQNETRKSTAMNDYLGYCTWNSLGQKGINVANINKALDSFERHRIPIGYLIMDDGWQEHQDGYVTGFDADTHKFPGGLSGTICSLKQRYPSLQSIGVWHILWGYWRGVDVASIGKLYSSPRSYYSSGSETLSEGGTSVYQILFDRVDQFYDDFYRHLANAGVDMVKIDYQGGMGDLRWQLSNETEALVPLTLNDKHQLWAKYRVAVALAMEKHLAAPPLHCMALNPHLLDCYGLKTEGTTNTWHEGIIRNSDDFFPDVSESHPWHIYGNIINSIWTTSSFSTVDFDMFQSAHPFGEYHAVSRAISGGPVYITDIPDSHDIHLLKKLTAENREGLQQILRCSQACWPLYDTLLGGKPMVDQDYIGAWNAVGQFGFVYGYWSMRMGNSHQCIATTPIPLGYIGFVSLGLDAGKWMYNLESKDDLYLPFRLADGGCSMVYVVPAYLYQPSHPSGTTGVVACLGLLDKLNGLQPIIHVEMYSTSSSQSSHRERSNLLEHGTTYIFEARLSHRSSQCGFLLSCPTIATTATPTSSSSTAAAAAAAAEILWAKVDDTQVQLEKLKQRHEYSLEAAHQEDLWILDMTEVPLAASNARYFSIEICISC